MGHIVVLSNIGPCKKGNQHGSREYDDLKNCGTTSHENPLFHLYVGLCKEATIYELKIKTKNKKLHTDSKWAKHEKILVPKLPVLLY